MRLRALLAFAAVICSVQSYAAIIYVDNKATGANNGSSWVNAYTTLQAGINAATSSDQVWVGSGTYNELRTGNATGSLALKANVPVYGGFKGNVLGTGYETALSQRDWFTNIAIIDGTNGRGAGLKAYHVVTGAAGATIDGFTIQNGDATGATAVDKRGGGVYVNNASITMTNCIIQNNAADNAGAGAYINVSASVISRCIFKNNTARVNTANGYGGAGMCLDTAPGNPTVTNCIFYGNQITGSAGGGGGLLIYGAISPIIQNCTFTANICPAPQTPPGPGTGTAGGGGAMHVAGGATPTVRNCIFWGDSTSPEVTANTLGNPASADNAVLPTLTNCIHQGVYAGAGAPVNSNPNFDNSDLARPARLSSTSSAAINQGSTTGAPSNDYLGTTRTGNPDIGAYEYDGTAPTCVFTDQLINLSPAGTATLNPANVTAGSSDAGGIKTITLSKTNLTCADVGVNTPLSATLTDYAGNSNTSCNGFLTVQDVTSPQIISCASAIIVNATSGCSAVMPSMTADVTASDACGVIKTQSPLAGATISGTVTVTFTVRDPSNNSVTCSTTVTVQDVDNPVITNCPPSRSVVANASCQGTVPNMVGEVAATDNCTTVGNLSIAQSPIAGSTISGTTTVTFTVTDEAGRQATCTNTLTIADNTAPTITTCPAAQNLSLNASCQTTVPNLVALTAATDNCGVTSITQSPVAGTTLTGAGLTVVTISAKDAANNEDTCTVNLNVSDVTNPTITTCASATTVFVDSACSALTPDVTAGVVASDNCGVASTTQSPVAGSAIPLGDTIVTITVTDVNSNTSQCAVVVTAADNIDPVITTCSPGATLSRSGSCDALVPNLTGDVVATDNCTVSPTITQSPLAGTLITADTVVTLTATDAAGNDTTCTANVTLVDDQDPVITQCAPGVAVNLDANCEAIIPDLTASTSSTDNCGVASTVQSPVAGTTIIADTLVTITVTDTSGNDATCQSLVTIADIIPPVITTCPPDQTLSLSAICDAQIPDFTATTVATDNCTIQSITQSPVVGTVITADTVVTVTVTDIYNNSVQCTTNALVVDDTLPVITVTGSPVVAYLTGQPYTELGATATDNCDTNLPAVTIGGDVVDHLTPGIYIVTYNVTDASGNDALEVTRQVTYTLNTPPVITIIGDNPATVECVDTYTDQGATAFDDDQGDITVDMTTVSNVDQNAIGTYQVTYTVTDNAFTTVQEVRTVNVVDTTPPVITVLGDPVVTHECSTPYTDAGATASDICAGDITARIITDNPVDENTYTGTYTVTYTVTDDGNNTTVATRTVNVVDTTIPVLTLNGASTVNHECGTVYNDLGAFASDTCDGDITVLIDVNNPVSDLNDTGTYTVTYDVLDAANNAAVQITRTVNVVDTLRPVITLVGSQVVAVPQFTPYVEQGANAADTCDGTDTVVITGTVNTNVAGSYFIQYNAVDTNGNVAVEVVRTVLVQGTNSPPLILQQPQDLTVNYSATAQFVVVASSPPLAPMTYRWSRNGVDISDNAKYSGTTTDTLTINNAANSDEANYAVRVTNSNGPTNSSPAALTVIDPAIIQQPQDRTVIAGTTVQFITVAVGSGTLQYQWFFDGTPIANSAKYSGTQTGTLSLTDAQNSDEGEYFCQVTGADGMVESEHALLDVGNPAIITNPVGLTIDPGDTATFNVTAQGTPPLLYRWRKNGVNLVNGGRFSGVNTTQLTITNCIESDEGAYSCIVIGQEIVISDDAPLRVNDPPVLGPIALNPVSGVLSPGASGTLTILIAGGTPPFTFQWSKDGQPVLTKNLTGGTQQVLSVTSASEADEGVYTCTVTNSAGSVTSEPAQLSVGLTIFADLGDRNAEEGLPFLWSVGVGGGTGNLDFVWYKFDGNDVPQPLSDGAGLSGTATDVLNFTPVDLADQGFYRVEVSDSLDTVTSRKAFLRVVTELPLAGGLGIALTAGIASLLGAAALRRKKQS